MPMNRMVRRSGVAVCLIADLLKWSPTSIYQVGVGLSFKEVDAMVEMWPLVPIVGHEPHPITYRDVKGVYPGYLHNIAISNFVGKTKLHSKSRHRDGASLFEHLKKGDKDLMFEVGVTTLDALYPKGPKGKQTLLWLDCEGSELDALKGAENFIKSVEFINVEMSARGLGSGACNTVDTHNWLLEHGFFRQWIHTQRTSAGQYDAIYVRQRLFQPTYCCCPCQIQGEKCGSK